MLIYCKFLTEQEAVDYRSFLAGPFLFAVLGRAFSFISLKFVTGKYITHKEIKSNFHSYTAHLDNIKFF